MLFKKTNDYPEATERARAGAFRRRASHKKSIQLAREISHGEQRQLELAIALAAAPRVLLLDEPAAGLSPEETRNMVALVRALKGRYTIVLIEHKIDIIMSVSDRISVMHFGSAHRRGHARGDPAQRGSAPRLPRRDRGMILELQNIDAFYGLGHILHGLSLSVGEGEVVALLGRNGAGKTTTLRCITGLTPPRTRRRSATRAATSPASEPTAISRLGIALVPETRDIFSYLTAKENLAIARAPRLALADGQRARALPGPEGTASATRGASSPAASSRCSPSRARSSPAPTSCCWTSPRRASRRWWSSAVMDTIRELKSERVSMLLVEQNAEMALQLADRVYVIDHGTVVFEGTPAALRADRQVTTTYLGVGG